MELFKHAKKYLSVVSKIHKVKILPPHLKIWLLSELKNKHKYLALVIIYASLGIACLNSHAGNEKINPVNDQVTIKVDKLVINAPNSPSKTEKKSDETKAIPIKTLNINGVDSLTKLPLQIFSSTVNWFNKHKVNLLILFIGLIITWTLIGLFKRLLRNLLMKRWRWLHDNELDGLVYKAVGKPSVMFIFFFGLLFSSLNIIRTLQQQSFEFTMRCFIAILAGALAWGIYRSIAVFEAVIRHITDRTQNVMDDLLVELIRKALKVTVVVIAVLFIGQSILGLNITALVAGAGVMGLAVAFAAKDTIANFLGSIMIILDKPFAIGERIIVNGVNGTVEDIGFRCTRVRSLDGHLYSFPNNKLADSVIENVTKRPFLKYAFDLTVTYDTSPEKMEEAITILHDILDKHPGFSAEQMPRIFFTAFNDWALNINVTLWFQTTDYAQSLTWKNDINLAILRRFNAAGIEFAFPSSTNYLVQQETQSNTQIN